MAVSTTFASRLILNEIKNSMQTIRTSFNQKYPITQLASFWSTVGLAITPVIKANAAAFEALTRMGQPFGGNIMGR
jgi:hypothetical protein